MHLKTEYEVWVNSNVSCCLPCNYYTLVYTRKRHTELQSINILFALVFSCFSNGTAEKSRPHTVAVSFLFKDPLLSPPSAFTCFHIAQSFRDITSQLIKGTKSEELNVLLTTLVLV